MMSDNMITIVCNRCGSKDVESDAWVVWSVEDQEWVLGGMLGHAYCNNCEDDTSLIEKEISNV